MKAQNPGGLGAGRRGRSSMRIPQVPMEWMDPMSWRLPSGKALAEFALQAGFLAPLMLSSPLGMPAFKKRQKKAESPDTAALDLRRELKTDMKAGIEKQVGEGPEQSGSFRQTR